MRVNAFLQLGAAIVLGIGVAASASLRSVAVGRLADSLPSFSPIDPYRTFVARPNSG